MKLRGILPPKYIPLVTIAPLVVALDQWTKHLVITYFRLGDSQPVFSGFFDFTYVRNTGAAFGMLAQSDPSFRIPFFLAVPVVAMGVVFYVLSKTRATDLRLPVALSLVAGGAVGNLIDRFSLGYVVDFLHFHWRSSWHFHVFNVADTAITLGVMGLFLDLLLKPENEPRASVGVPT